MKKIKTTYLAVVMLMLLPALALTACSDDDDTVHVKFDQSTIAGSWKVENMYSVVLTTDKNGKMERTTIQIVNYDSLYASFNNDKSYSIYKTASGTTTTTLERGTYTVVTGSFRIDLSSGRKLHWLKSEGTTMTLEEYNANDGSRRARYTLSKI
ncbi:MAG: hypothetical protein SPM31_01645 [Prevotella sp.]|uniref:hypothetical protein n=1 Tax=Prevotella sp. TaxID=59823 RepID=UPI002590E16D|nr:hypothetical protein [Prevotella sp.]MDD6854068.1 hypothetical protein [Prevotella sp.]MDY6265812.1 hypothetical protein [Prevotella sp.]